jgi:hypothetical protein
MPGFDTVVGSGSAGGVLAERLSEGAGPTASTRRSSAFSRRFEYGLAP